MCRSWSRCRATTSSPRRSICSTASSAAPTTARPGSRRCRRSIPNDRANRPARAGDSVSPIIITSNDLAGAWAAREDGSPLYPLTPGGPRQREMALRGGVNLVMYALTGNYKADQVHARDLLERLAR